MKLISMRCPECNGSIDINCNQRKYIFCPYCGSQIAVDRENEVEITINKNISITKTKRNIDDAKISKAKYKGLNELFGNIGMLFIVIVCFAVMIMAVIFEHIEKKDNLELGKVSVGSSSEYEGQNYEVVLKSFENMGFEDVEVIDLNDAGLTKKEDCVDKVSISGNDTFSSDDYFYKSEPVLITYH